MLYSINTRHGCCQIEASRNIDLYGLGASLSYRRRLSYQCSSVLDNLTMISGLVDRVNGAVRSIRVILNIIWLLL